jgi:ribosomal protein S13
MGAIMQGIELDDVNHIPLAMNEFCGVGQRETKKLLENRVGQCLNRPRLIYLRPLGML